MPTKLVFYASSFITPFSHFPIFPFLFFLCFSAPFQEILKTCPFAVRLFSYQLVMSPHIDAVSRSASQLELREGFNINPLVAVSTVY